jgi:hypothetical protein
MNIDEIIINEIRDENSKLYAAFSYNNFAFISSLIFFIFKILEIERMFNILFILNTYEKKKIIGNKYLYNLLETKNSNLNDK